MAARTALVAFAAAVLGGHAARPFRRRQATHDALKVQKQAAALLGDASASGETAAKALFEWTKENLVATQDPTFDEAKKLADKGWTKVGGVLGGGDFASVYEVTKVGFGPSVVKVVRLAAKQQGFLKSRKTWSSPSNDAQSVAAQAIAAQAIAAQLGHSPKVLDAFLNVRPNSADGEAEAVWMMIMEKVEGMTLEAFAEAKVGESFDGPRCLLNDDIGKKTMPKKTYDTIVHIVKEFNRRGLVTADAHSRNFMIDPASPGNVKFIDFDLVLEPHLLDEKEALALVLGMLQCPHPDLDEKEAYGVGAVAETKIEA